MQKEGKRKDHTKNVLISLIVLLIIGIGVFVFLLKLQTDDRALTGSTVETSEAQKETQEMEKQTEQAEYTIEISRLGFSPKELTINKGDKVKWVNTKEDKADLVIFLGRSDLNSLKIFPGDEYVLTFDESGEFEYVSPVSEAKAKIIVK